MDLVPLTCEDDYRADNCKIYYFQFQRAIPPKIGNPELQLPSACRLMMIYTDMQAGRTYQVVPSAVSQLI